MAPSIPGTPPTHSGLFTDFYELTMMQGYLLNGVNPPAVFDLFFRRQPFAGGFAVFAGLEAAMESLEELHFDDDDLAYLRSQEIFTPRFLDFLSGFRFSGELYAMDEGRLAFAGEPVVRVHAPLMEAQLIDSQKRVHPAYYVYMEKLQ